MAPPIRIRLRMYQVGFGDCFLLSFEYRSAPVPVDDRKVRHVLIDFGTKTIEGTGVTTTQIAERIQRDAGGHLDAVVVTHRHQDHMSGFAMKAAKKHLDPLKPDLVVRPWTEDPNAKKNARGARRQQLDLLEQRDRFLKELSGIPKQVRGLRGELRAKGKEELTNADAIKRLTTWADPDRGEYLHYGQATRLEQVLPGVRVSVLGPPTAAQYPEVLKAYRQQDPNYWLRLAAGPRAGTAASGSTAKDLLKLALRQPARIRWLVEKMDQQDLFRVMRIVRIMDDMLNNTSLVLLFEVGDRRLLFAGDAQIESWEYVLTKDGSASGRAFRKKLGHIDLYKVGHHGSLNATPKRSLYGLWTKSRRRMTFALSTKKGHYGKTEDTYVPQGKLLAGLKQLGDVYSTHTLKEKVPVIELVASVRGGGRFKAVDPKR